MDWRPLRYASLPFPRRQLGLAATDPHDPELGEAGLDNERNPDFPSPVSRSAVFHLQDKLKIFIKTGVQRVLKPSISRNSERNLILWLNLCAAQHPNKQLMW